MTALFCNDTYTQYIYQKRTTHVERIHGNKPASVVRTAKKMFVDVEPPPAPVARDAELVGVVLCVVHLDVGPGGVQQFDLREMSSQ